MAGKCKKEKDRKNKEREKNVSKEAKTQKREVTTEQRMEQIKEKKSGVQWESMEVYDRRRS